MDCLEESALREDEFYSFKVKKLLKNALEDKEIDFYNFFKDKEIQEHDLTSPKGSITDTKEFEEFLKKRKHSKMYKTSRSILHSGCEGCMSSSFDPGNNFIFCQQCGVRFHQTCFEGMYFTEKTVICTACSLKLAKTDKKKRIKKK